MRGQRGFSLIELLVVLAIAGLMTGLAVAGLGNGQASVEQALQRLAVKVRGQAALARHAGQLRGLRWNGQRPEFVRREGNAWVVEAVPLGDWPRACTRTGRPARNRAYCSRRMAGRRRVVCAGAGPMAVSNGPGAAPMACG